MRRYDVVSGILFILSIIDFALAAPVLVQEKRQACVDVVHIVPKDVITALPVGKRGDEALEKLLEEYFNNMGKQFESSDAHVSSSSAPPRSDHGSTNVVQTPGPNPASSTTNLLIGPSGPDHENKWPWTYPDTNFDWNYWANLDDAPLSGPAPPKQPKYVYKVEHVQQPNPGPSNTRPPNEYFEMWKQPNLQVESSDVHASSSSALTGPGPALQPNPNKRPLRDPDPNFNWDWGRPQSTNRRFPAVPDL